jgi:hypothetical protein
MRKSAQSAALILAIALTSMPIYGTEPEMAEFAGLSCQLAGAMKAAFPEPEQIEHRRRLFSAALSSHAHRKSGNADSFEFRGKFYEKLQALYHKVFGYEGFYVYPAMIPDAQINYNSVLSRILILSASHREQLRKAAGDGTLDLDFIEKLESKDSPEFRAAMDGYAKILSNDIMEPMLIGLGPTADELALWMLTQPKRSIHYQTLLAKALELSDGDPWSALGLVSSVSAWDAAGRGNVGTLLTDKLILPKAFEKFRDRAGVNYHFWCYIALAYVQSPIALRALSFGYETVLQGDYAEAAADQFGVTVANLANWKYASSPAYGTCGNPSDISVRSATTSQ